MFYKDYDAWINKNLDEQNALQYQREREITRLMDEQNITYEDAESYFDHMMEQAEEDHIACLVEDLR